MHLRSRSLKFTSLLLVFILIIPCYLSVGAQDSIVVRLTQVIGRPAEDQMFYNVVAYVSVLDGEGNSRIDLGTNDFELFEDSQKVEIGSVMLVADIPIAFVLLVDTSWSMRGQKILALQEALLKFLDQFHPEDQAALMEFNDETNLVLDVTKDWDQLKRAVSELEPEPYGATCLYDATYGGVEIAATISEDRRVVVLLTDGMDDSGIPDQPCSLKTIEDVIEFASDANVSVPIYALGIGDFVDEYALSRLADRTGGAYLFTPTASDIEGLFSKVADQLKYQYVLTYESTASPGSHTLIVRVNDEGSQDQDTRGFLLPAFPPQITILQPVDGTQVEDDILIIATISGHSGLVDHVVFYVGGEVLFSDATPPYQLNIKMGDLSPGALEIVVQAMGANGEIISQDMTTIVVPSPPTVTVEPVETALPTATMITTAQSEDAVSGSIFNLPNWLIGIALVLISIVAYLFFSQRKRKSSYRRPLESKTFDGIAADNVLATLEIVNSDNEMMIGRTINIEKKITTIGRSATNDIILPDKPVSRRHVEIRYAQNVLTIREIASKDKYGEMKRPTYGTFINGKRIGADAVQLKDGDEILIGRRACLRVGLPLKVDGDEEHTTDVPLYQSDEFHLESTEVDFEKAADFLREPDLGHAELQNNGISTSVEEEPEENIASGIDIDQTREVDEENGS